MSKSNLRKCFR